MDSLWCPAGCSLVFSRFRYIGLYNWISRGLLNPHPINPERLNPKLQCPSWHGKHHPPWPRMQPHLCGSRGHLSSWRLRVDFTAGPTGLYGSFRKLGLPYFGVLRIRILLFRVLGSPIFGNSHITLETT